MTFQLWPPALNSAFNLSSRALTWSNTPPSSETWSPTDNLAGRREQYSEKSTMSLRSVNNYSAQTSIQLDSEPWLSNNTWNKNVTCSQTPQTPQAPATPKSIMLDFALPGQYCSKKPWQEFAVEINLITMGLNWSVNYTTSYTLTSLMSRSHPLIRKRVWKLLSYFLVVPSQQYCYWTIQWNLGTI